MWRVADEAELSGAIDMLLSDGNLRRRMSEAAMGLASSGSGATLRTAESLLSLLPGRAREGGGHA
jgi:hypothetical protein